MKEALPTYKLMDYCKANIFVLSLKNALLPKELYEMEEFNVWKPHYSDYYLFYYIEKGTFSIMVDLEEVILVGPVFFYILPRQVKCLLDDGVKIGWSLTVKGSLVERRLGYVFEKEIFNPLPIRAPGNTATYVSECLKLLHHMNNAGDATLNIQLNLASSCMEMIANAYLKNGWKNRYTDSQKLKHTRDFFDLLKEKYDQQKKPLQYARDLNLAPAYLNECVKSVTRKSVSFWIQQEIVLEAKRLLFYTELSIKEIAYRLGFDDHAYFSRLFVNNTKMTAKEFRNQFRMKAGK